MPDLGSLLERESRTVEAPDDFERLVRRRDRKQRNRRIATGALALVLAGVAIGLAVRAFQGAEHRTPATIPSIAPVAACPGSAPDEPGPVDQARPRAHGYSTPMAFDREFGRIVLLEDRLSGDSPTWTFDVCSNTWMRMGSSLPKSPTRGGVELVYDVDSERTLAVGDDGIVWAYDLEADAWTENGVAPGKPPFRLVYDPVSGLVLFQSFQTSALELWTYDAEADTWAEVQQEGTPLVGSSADHNLLAYDASVDRVVMYDGDSCGGCPSGDRTRLLDPRTGVWSASEVPTPDVNTGFWASGGEIAYDEAAQRVVVFSDGFVGAYDATADRWTRLYGRERCCQEGPLNRLGHWMVYDPLNERLVVYGGSYRTSEGWVKADDVWAFDAADRTWLQLLAPSEEPTGATG